MEEALTRSVDSVTRVRGGSQRAAGDWTMTDGKGRKWGWDSGGILVGRFGLAVQPPALTDQERARLASRTDIARFSLMTPGDADFNRLKAELRQRREQARRDTLTIRR